MRLKVLLFIVSLIYCKANAQWESLNTGINDNLNGVVFFQQNGIVSGENGLYYTTNGGSGSSSWTELHDYSNLSSAIFENTRFTHCYAAKTNATNTGLVYACGQNLTDNKAVLFRINIPAMTYELIYQGAANTKLNKIDCEDYATNFVAVGNNGKAIKFQYNTLTEMTPITTSDLVAVSYVSFGNISFGSLDKIWKCGMSGNLFYDISSTDSSLITNEDISTLGNSIYTAGGNRVNYLNFSNSITPVSTINFVAPLDANSIVLDNSTSYVGTDHGIYKYVGGGSGFQLGSYEFQLSSGSLKYNEFWWQSSGTTMYACGDNGLVVKTTNGGGATKPYASINATGTCVNGTVQFTAVTGSGNSARWFVDNQQESTSLTGFNKVFNSIGRYLIRLEVTNSFNETTIVSKYIDIVPVPTINKPIAINDVILCKAESFQVSIENSEPNVKYVLRKVGQPFSSYGESPVGNNGTVVLNSVVIDATANFYIDAVNTLANCSRRFDADFLITVEKTKADFHSGNINAYVNEPISYYNQSAEAQNFAWQFNSASGTQNSNLPNPQNTYTAAGQVTVNLDAWSNNGCHDVITENGPNIITPVTSSADCMLLINNGVDAVNDESSNVNNISQINTVSDGGLLTCGAYTNTTFDSEHGITYTLSNKQGAYLTKHDQYGVLKWMVYTVNQNISTANGAAFTSCVEDLEGNIYISGRTPSGVFCDNAGRVIDITVPTSGFATLGSFIVKLNSKGELIWRFQTTSLQFYKLSIDKTNNLVVNVKYPYYPTVPIYFNGTFVQDLDFNYPYNGSYDQYDVFGMIKINPSGSVLWNSRIITDQVNGFMTSVIGFDDSNNMYVSSSFETKVDFYSANTNSNTRSLQQDGNLRSKVGIAKYSSDGTCLWAMRSRNVGTLVRVFDDIGLGDGVVDDNGNVYITGHNACRPESVGYTHVFDNADGTVTETTKGSYYLAKVNTNGICEWIRSTAYNAIGGGGELTKDADELFVYGGITSGNSNPISSAEFEGGLNSNYTLTMNRYNFAVKVYDFDGNLKRVFLNSDYDNSSLQNSTGERHFIKDQNGNFYLSRNWYRAEGYREFGYVMPALVGRDGVVVKFKESCGVLMYDATLSTEDNSLANSSLYLYPNPTSGDFNVDLKNIYKNIAMEIYDIYGKVVKKENYSNQEKIKTNLNCATGIYFVKLNCDNKIKWLKLVKE
ncbi:T9SS type A sorting domain-containing protein [Flavobacterium pedocola]